MFHKTASNEGTDYDTLMEGKKERHKTQSLPVKPTPYLQSTFVATEAWCFDPSEGKVRHLITRTYLQVKKTTFMTQ